MGDLRELLSDAETLVGAFDAGYSQESLEALRERLKASHGRIAGGYQRLREKVAHGEEGETAPHYSTLPRPPKMRPAVPVLRFGENAQ